MVSTENGKSFDFDIEFDNFNPEIESQEKMEDLDPKWSDLAENNFRENSKNREGKIVEFREKIKEEKLEKSVQILIGESSYEMFCLKFLRAGGFDLNRSFKVLKNYLDNLVNNWSYFEKSSQPTVLKTVFDDQIHTVLTHRDKNGRRVFAIRPGLWDVDKISFEDLFCAGYVLSEVVALETKTQITGVTSVIDAQNFGVRQLKNFSLENAKNLSNFIQDSFPVWFHEVHIINTPLFFKIAYQIIKPFLNERIRNNITFHPDLDSLHQSVDAKILPKEFGGEQGSFDNSNCFEAYNTKRMTRHFQNVKQFVQMSTMRNGQ